MPCNCGKKNSARTTWVYTDPNGNQQTYATEVEAKAAMIRGGGGNVSAS